MRCAKTTIIADVQYRNNHAGFNDIISHLNECASLFFPSLDSCVNINQYGSKIQRLANTFEAWHNKKLVGMVAAYLNDRGTLRGFVTSVSVLIDYQGYGIASNLLDMTIQQTVELGFKSLALEVESANTAALTLYQKKGFIAIEENKGKYLMIRIL